MFLANENFPKPSIQEETPGISDVLVIQRAVNESLVILTFDKDYGELIFRYQQDNPPSVIYFRDKGDNPLFAGISLLNILQQGFIKLENSFSVIEKKILRQRFYKKL